MPEQKQYLKDLSKWMQRLEQAFTDVVESCQDGEKFCDYTKHRLMFSVNLLADSMQQIELSWEQLSSNSDNNFTAHPICNVLNEHYPFINEEGEFIEVLYKVWDWRRTLQDTPHDRKQLVSDAIKEDYPFAESLDDLLLNTHKGVRNWSQKVVAEIESLSTKVKEPFNVENIFSDGYLEFSAPFSEHHINLLNNFGIHGLPLEDAKAIRICNNTNAYIIEKNNATFWTEGGGMDHRGTFETCIAYLKENLW